MTLIDGLHLYEVILLILGVLLFVLAAVLLVTQVLRHRDAKVLIPLFAIAAAMIGFPGTKSLSFGEMKAELKTLSARLEADPGDSLARAEAGNILARMEKQPVAREDTRLLMERVRLVLREPAVPPDPGTELAPRRPQRLWPGEMERLTGIVTADPQNRDARERLELLVRESGSSPDLSEKERALIKRATAALKPR